MKLAFSILLFSAMAFRAPAQAGPGAAGAGVHHLTMTVKLLSPISTRTSNQGDTFTVLVESPPSYRGALIEGKITKLNKARRGVRKGKPEITFAFESLTAGGRTFPIVADLKQVTNSKGLAAVDDEGNAIGTTSNRKRVTGAVAGGALGAIIGGLSSGAVGAAVGAAAGAAAGMVIALTMTTSGSDVELYPGSVFTLEVSDRQR